MEQNQRFRSIPFKIKFGEYDALIQRDPNSFRVPETVQLLRVGTFRHEKFGELTITVEMLQSMVRNFDSGVRGIDIMIDYKHDSENIAAAWVTGLELSENDTELWATVKWTPEALKKLTEKEFRYLSADFCLDYQDNESLQKFGPTLFGAGLTNRPVVKRMEAILELSEIKTKSKIEINEGETMKEKEKIKELEAEIVSLKELEDKHKKLQVKLDELQEGIDGMSPEQMVAMIKNLKAEIESLKGDKEKMAQDKELAEKGKTFDKLLSDGKAVEAQRQPYIDGDMTKYVELTSLVNLAESKGNGKIPVTESGDGDVQDKINALAEAKVKESNGALDIYGAIKIVLSEQPKLNKEYEAIFN